MVEEPPGQPRVQTHRSTPPRLRLLRRPYWGLTNTMVVMAPIAGPIDRFGFMPTIRSASAGRQNRCRPPACEPTTGCAPVDGSDTRSDLLSGAGRRSACGTSEGQRNPSGRLGHDRCCSPDAPDPIQPRAHSASVNANAHSRARSRSPPAANSSTRLATSLRHMNARRDGVREAHVSSSTACRRSIVSGSNDSSPTELVET